LQLVPSSFVLTIIAFVVLYLVLNKYAWGPLLNTLEKRREKVVGQLALADQDRKAASDLLEEQKAALNEARKEAYQIIEQAKNTSTKQAEDIIGQAKNEAVRLKEEALRDIESEKRKAIAALQAEVGAISVAIAAKIIEKQVDEASQQALVDQYLKEVGGVQ